jgi:hypothetical protein
MPYLPHLKISVLMRMGSTYADAQETASIGLRWKTVIGDFTTLVQDAIDSCAGLAYTAWSGIADSTMFMTHIWFEGIKAYSIGPDGRAVGPIGASIGTGTLHGAGSANYAPYQVADVVSLVAEGRGKGKFGRVYLPGINAGVDGTGLRPPAQPDALLTPFRNMLKSMDSALAQSEAVGQDVSLCVAGTTGGGTLRPVAEVRWGHVPDTQRRRRRKLVEAYAVQAYPGT